MRVPMFSASFEVTDEARQDLATRFDQTQADEFIDQLRTMVEKDFADPQYDSATFSVEKRSVYEYIPETEEGSFVNQAVLSLKPPNGTANDMNNVSFPGPPQDGWAAEVGRVADIAREYFKQFVK